MSIFDLFKKESPDKRSAAAKVAKEKHPSKCTECMCRIKGHAWELGGKRYCQACYNRRMANGLRGFTYQKLDFEMSVDDVFSIKNHGVAVTGTIRKGCIYRGDTAVVNGHEYTVTRIDVIPHEVDSAKAGMNVALHLSSADAGLFKRGDIVTLKPLEDDAKKTTFTCDICGKEFPLKYRHKGDTCSGCAETATASRRTAPSNDPCKPSLEQYSAKLKKYAMRFIPGDINEIGTQRQMLKMVGAVIPVNEFLMGPEISRIFASNALGEWTMQRLQASIAAKTDRWAGGFEESKLHHAIMEKDTDTLIKAWIVLTFYCDILKPEFKENLSRYHAFVTFVIYERCFVVPEPEYIVPIEYVGDNIMISSEKFFAWKKQYPLASQFELCGVLPLTEKEPKICLYEDGMMTREYVLQTEGNEDHTGKYFLISVRMGMQGDPAVPAVQIDGFVSDTPEERKMTSSDIGYRMEGHFLACGGENSKRRHEMNRGQDLPMKALKYPGYTTPANIRLIGVCPDCGKSFCFHGYAFYMMQNDVAYSDDGLDCCQITAQNIDKDNWSYEADGKTFRYYNSFNCPHCGTPYIDYRKHPENKMFGVSGCVLLGRKHYQSK